MSNNELILPCAQANEDFMNISTRKNSEYFRVEIQHCGINAIVLLGEENTTKLLQFILENCDIDLNTIKLLYSK